MVRDGIYYAAGLAAVAALVAWLTAWPFALAPLALAAFFLWFFRDPERAVPAGAGVIVSPADGKVTDISTVEVDGERRTRLSIFMNVFDVHVNRSPVGGVIRAVEYRRGCFRNALNAVVRRDVDLAQKVLATDDQVDHYRDQIFRELLTYMMGDSSVIFPAFELILVAKNLERIGDHATNIAEDVIYLVQGQDIRHPTVDRR